MLSGGGAERDLDSQVPLALHRMYYAKRHGYGYLHLLSNQFAPYFSLNTWEVRERVTFISWYHYV